MRRRGNIRLALFALLCVGATWFASCNGEADPDARKTIVLLWWEGVPPEASFAAQTGRPEALPTLASLPGLVRHEAYYPSSELSETRLATILIEDGRVPEPAGRLDWGARRVPEGVLAGELRESGFRRLAAVSRTELACLETQFDLFAAPPPEAAASALTHDFALRALDEQLERTLAGDDKLFLMVATDVLARRDAPTHLELAPHLRARLAPLASEEPDVADMLSRLDARPAEAAEALRELLNRRRGEEVWDALQQAEADARLARVDRWLGEFLARLELHGRRDSLQLVVAGGAARDPWDVALGTQGEGRALLYTLGMPQLDALVQEAGLREALRATVRGEASVVTRPDPFLSRVVAHAGETELVLRCRVEGADAVREQLWLSDVGGERPAPGTETRLEPAEFVQRLGADWARERVGASNRGDEPVALELFLPQGELAARASTPVGRRSTTQLIGGDTTSFRTTRLRPALIASWTGAGVDESRCAIGSLRLADSDLPVVPLATDTEWPEGEPAARLQLTAAGAWQSVLVGSAGDGDVELCVEAWPPRIDPGGDWLRPQGDARVEAHPLRPGAWIVRGSAPLAVDLLRQSNGSFGYCARVGGRRVMLAETSVEGLRASAEGSVTILLSSGAWNDAALYGAPPEGPFLGLRWLGTPPREPVQLPSAAERLFLIRAARTR